MLNLHNIVLAASAPSAESIESDRLALQRLLAPYSPEDIWKLAFSGK
jgi:hypothetical protein